MDERPTLQTVPFTIRSLVLRIFIVLLPLLPCTNLHTYFDGDWINHLWMIQYQGESLKGNLHPQAIYNTTTVLGITTSLFYAEHFYVLAGLFSMVMGPDLAFRLITFGLLFSQLLHIERAFRYVTNSPHLPLFIATLLTWAIYPLTNLYSRSALTEFAASCLLNIAFSCLLVFALELFHGRKSVYDFIAIGLFYTLSAVTHPLNALFGGLFFVIFGVALIFVLRNRWYYYFLAANSILSILVLLPWIYVVRLFQHSLPVADAAVNAKNFRYGSFPYDAITNLLTRLSPFPIEFRALIDGSKISTPHQDGQILLPLLILIAVLYYFRFLAKRTTDDASTASTPQGKKFELFLQTLFYSALTVFTITFMVSIYPRSSALFGGLFDILQFCYRLINYVNLSLIAIAWLLLAFLKSRNKPDVGQNQLLLLVMVACFTMSLCALYEKLVHAETLLYVRQFNMDDFPEDFERTNPVIYQTNPLALPRTSYGHFAYIITNHIQPASATAGKGDPLIADIPLDASHFGATAPLTLTLPTTAFIRTNVETFPWNYILLDGNVVDWKELYPVAFLDEPDDTSYVYGLQLPAGKHMLEYQFRPDFLWTLLHTISWIVLAAWILSYCIALYFKLRYFIRMQWV